MKVGVTSRFQNSYFSGSLPQLACALARTFQKNGHDVTLLYPSEDSSWFIDVTSFANESAPRKLWSNDQVYDMIIEVVWMLNPSDRVRCAKQVVYFAHFPPVFHDMESCVYTWNPTQRNFQHVSAIWTYDHYTAQDVRYLEFLSGAPVYQTPYVWDPDALDVFVAENQVPSWFDSAARLEAAIPEGTPPMLSWSARIVESNFSSTSHCIIPLNIVSQIRIQGDPIRVSVHNGEQTANNEFFQANIIRNLVLPDISGNMIPRVRLPDLRREKAVLISHQRFRPLKSFLLDALYLGIPMIHNCARIRDMGAPYYYELNQISQAVGAWNTLKSEYAARIGFFAADALRTRQASLRARFSPQAVGAAYDRALTATATPRPNPRLHSMALPAASSAGVKPPSNSDLRVAFCNMWDQFQPSHNFFMYLLSWVGAQNNVRVVLDEIHPNVVFFGPFSNGSESKYPGIPKVYFTGENTAPNTHPDTCLNLGFRYDTSDNYIRLPLWVLEINWWGADVSKIKNPLPVDLSKCRSVDPDLLTKKSKFCAFVATNPSNNNRNAAFHILNQWRGVDSGGRLFCNLPSGPIPAGLGGGGGEHAKLEFYKPYRFALTFENSSSPGYTTEKLFHAKVAGCIPIYWGDPFVDRDFDPRGYINANQVGNAQDLIQLITKIAEDPDALNRMAAVPALSEFKQRWCEKTMEQISVFLFQRILGMSVQFKKGCWESASEYGAQYESRYSSIPSVVAPTTVVPAAVVAPVVAPKAVPVSPTISSTRIFITAANARYIECAVNAISSMHLYEPDIAKVVYVWPDVTDAQHTMLYKCGATEVRLLPTGFASETPWPDFWNPQHFAWKLWVYVNAAKEAAAGASILYLDAGTVISGPIDRIWKQIDAHDVFLLEDDEQTQGRWCHPTFCANLAVRPEELAHRQILAGLVGFKNGGCYNAIAQQALEIAKTQRETIVGEKWSPYSATCMGHRHDQSILSLLTQRAGCARLPMRAFYSDTSLRHAQQNHAPLYVHRGNYREILPFTDGIDEAYVINLARRHDRLASFRDAHKNIQERVYVHEAIDGRTLALTPDIVRCFRTNDFAWKKSVMGCALSHYGLWKQLATSKSAKTYFIMEDDVRLSATWLTQWMQASRHVPADADVIYLGGILPPNKPALPSITESVNSFFARVAKNAMFGSPPRRYFHFCNYSYILTQSGARKLCNLIEEKGIFTSGDHMIVNHGDDLLSIYFTTPLLATCFQENDPLYQTSEFNNFHRVDNFDSDLWNNLDCFTEEEIQQCLAAAAAPEPAPAATAAAAPTTTTTTTAAPSYEYCIRTWNELLQQVARNQKDALAESIRAVFAIWKSMTEAEFYTHISWFRIFEQLILTKHEPILAHADLIVTLIKATHNTSTTILWNKVLEVLDPKHGSAAPGIACYMLPPKPTQTIFHLKEVNAPSMLECQWLESIYQCSITWVPLENLDAFKTSKNPTLLYQTIPGTDLTNLYASFAEALQKSNVDITLLHLSDEFAQDNLSIYSYPAFKRILRNYWRPDIAKYNEKGEKDEKDEKVTCIPLGYANGRHAAHLPDPPTFEARTTLWAFAGSLDRQGRAEALRALHAAGPYVEHSKEKWSTPPPLDGHAYIKMLRNAKFVPCFRGSRALESYRIYEAIEHGAIPVYVPSESKDTADELRELYGGTHPFLGFQSWEQAATMLPILAKQTAVMEKHRQALLSWWAEQKKSVQALFAS